MEVLNALVDLLTTVNNPIANAAPVIAACFAWYTLATGIRNHRFSAGRRMGTGICTAVVTYSATLRTLLEFDAISTDRFLQFSTANAPLVFSCMAYLLYSRAQANIRMEQESRVIDDIMGLP